MDALVEIVLTQFAVDRHFNPDRAGTIISDRPQEIFEQEVNEFNHRHVSGRHLHFESGYADFCKLAFISNWTNAKTGTLLITPQNERYLKSGYQRRQGDELPVLARWFEGVPDVPRAEYLCLVLYDREHLAEEGTDIGEADWGIVAILGQLHNQEEPMTPMTAIRNALGVDEGGSGVSLDREAYMRSVDFWKDHAAVKV